VPLLKVVTVSTRTGRAGPPVAAWFLEYARKHGSFDVEHVDLADVALPLLDEPEHPRFRRYQREHTKRWAAIVDAADAFVFVTPEYDYGMPATLLNALHYLAHEWFYKAVGFVSYGGASGGMRSVQMAKLVITSLRMMPLPEAVAVPFFAKQIDAGVFRAEKAQEDSAKLMLDELRRWTDALAVLRRPAK
jgi:NAD(P)H-dependent FMN reductase